MNDLPLPPESVPRAAIRLATLSAVAAALAGILLLGLSGWFLTGAALAGAAGPAAVLAFNYLLPSTAIRLLAIVRTAARYGERLVSHRAALMAMASLRGELFARLARQDNRHAPDLSAGDASARLIGDIDALEDLIVRQPTRPAGFAAALVGVALAGFAGWRAAFLLAAVLAALPFLLAAAARRLTRAPAHEAAEALGALRTRYVDLAYARAEIAAYGLSARVTAELTGLAARLDGARARLHRGEGAIAALLAGYTALAVGLVLLAAHGSAPRAALAALATAGAIEAMAGLARTAFRRASVEEGLRRLALMQALPDHPPAYPQPAPAAQLTLGPLHLAPGARVAIAGRSGSGKTIVLETLAGLRRADITATVAGTAPAACSSDVLRGQLALAPQDATTIAGSIADNLRLARPGLAEPDLWAALHVACLDERVRALPAGLDTMLGEQGAGLSGGERKRLSLARALLAGRPWLLLDEPSEGLDAATETDLIGRLETWLAATGTSLILVSHRRAPLALAGAIVAVEELRA